MGFVLAARTGLAYVPAASPPSRCDRTPFDDPHPGGTPARARARRPAAAPRRGRTAHPTARPHAAAHGPARAVVPDLVRARRGHLPGAGRRPRRLLGPGR